MLVRPGELEVRSYDAFRFDALDRKRLVEPLSQNVRSNVESPLPTISMKTYLTY